MVTTTYHEPHVHTEEPSLIPLEQRLSWRLRLIREQVADYVAVLERRYGPCLSLDMLLDVQRLANEDDYAELYLLPQAG